MKTREEYLLELVEQADEQAETMLKTIERLASAIGWVLSGEAWEKYKNDDFTTEIDWEGFISELSERTGVGK